MKKFIFSILTTAAILVTGYDGGGSSSSNTNNTTTVPTVPIGLTATAGNAQVALAWAAVSGATSYNIYYSTTTGVSTTSGTKISGITAASYMQISLTNGTPYYYIVTALNSAGESTASSQATATPIIPITVPTAPTGLIATAGNAQVGSRGPPFPEPRPTIFTIRPPPA